MAVGRWGGAQRGTLPDQGAGDKAGGSHQCHLPATVATFHPPMPKAQKWGDIPRGVPLYSLSGGGLQHLGAGEGTGRRELAGAEPGEWG